MTLSELRIRERELKREIRAVRQKIKKARPAKPAAPGPSPDARRAEHRASTKALRIEVASMHGGHCGACRAELGVVWELHHVESGGYRRSRQRPGNVLPLCGDCHRSAHRGDLEALRRIANAPSLDAEARRAAQHRLDKVLEAKGIPVQIEEEAS